MDERECFRAQGTLNHSSRVNQSKLPKKKSRKLSLLTILYWKAAQERCNQWIRMANLSRYCQTKLDMPPMVKPLH